MRVAWVVVTGVLLLGACGSPSAGLRPLDQVFGNRIADVAALAGAPLLRITSLVNLGLDETDGSRLVGVEQLRAAGISVNGLA